MEALEGSRVLAALAAWGVLVLAYGLWRSVARPEPDPIRESGPPEPS